MASMSRSAALVKMEGRGAAQFAEEGLVVAAGRGLCADSLSGESFLAILLGSMGLDGAVFSAALSVFSAPLRCSPLRSLSQSPRPPEVWSGFAEVGDAPRGRKRSLCSLSARGEYGVSRGAGVASRGGKGDVFL